MTEARESDVTNELARSENRPSRKEKAGWRDLLPAGRIVGGANAPRFETGDWRTLRPEWIPERCIHCYLCWIYCPDLAVFVEGGKMQGFDFKHCKGCGICAKECPVHAIDMLPETATPEEREEETGKELK